MGRFDAWGTFAQGQQIGTEQVLQAVGMQQRQEQLAMQQRREQQIIEEIEREQRSRAADANVSRLVWEGNLGAIDGNEFAQASQFTQNLARNQKAALEQRAAVEEQLEKARKAGTVSMLPDLRKKAVENNLPLLMTDYPKSEREIQRMRNAERNSALLNQAQARGVLDAIGPGVSLEDTNPDELWSRIVSEEQRMKQQAAIAQAAATGNAAVLAPFMTPNQAADDIRAQQAAKERFAQLENQRRANRELNPNAPEAYFNASDAGRSAYDANQRARADAAAKQGEEQRKLRTEAVANAIGSLRKQIEAETKGAVDVAGMAAKNVDTLNEANKATDDTYWIGTSPEKKAAQDAANAAPIDAASRAQAAMRAAELAPQRLQAVNLLEQAAQNPQQYAGPQGIQGLRQAAKMAMGEAATQEEIDGFLVKILDIP